MSKLEELLTASTGTKCSVKESVRAIVLGSVLTFVLGSVQGFVLRSALRSVFCLVLGSLVSAVPRSVRGAVLGSVRGAVLGSVRGAGRGLLSLRPLFPLGPVLCCFCVDCWSGFGVLVLGGGCKVLLRSVCSQR